MSSISSTSSSSTASTTAASSAATTASALSQLISNNSTSSGLNDNNIINELVAIESQPITNLKTQQASLRSQISAIAQITSALQSLATASQALQSNGVVGLTAGANTGFTAAAALGAQAGTYQIDVQSLAVAAKTRSQGYASTDTAMGGALHLTVQGQSYTVNVADGSTLTAVTQAIASSGAPVSASVISDGTHSYLSITANSSGFPPTGTAADALGISFTPASGGTGTAPSFASVATAQNASLTVDGLSVTSPSNSITKVIPGITLNLTAVDAAPETLNIQADTATTAANLQTFVTAYNGAMSLVQAQLAVTSGTDRTTTLAGDPTLRDLQQRLQSLFTSSVSEATGLNSLPAIGLSTSETDGSLSLDTVQLASALAKAPNAVNAMFGFSADSIAALAGQISTDYTQFGTGALSARTTGLTSEIADLTTQEDSLSAQLAIYQQNLIQQFANMETIVSTLKSTSSFLTLQSAAANKTGG